MTDSVTLYGRVSVGTAAQEALALLEGELQDGQYAVDQAIFKKIEDGTLTGDAAMIAFAEKHALSRVLLRLHQKVKTGVSAARHLSNHERPRPNG